MEIGKKEPMEEVEVVEEPIEYHIYSPDHSPSPNSPRYTPSPSPPDRSPPPRRTHGYYTRLYSNLAIEYYHANNKNDEFEVVDPLCFTSFYVEDDYESKAHVSFIAKSKSSSMFKLFFADFARGMRCLGCTIVEPGNPFFAIGCGGCNPAGAIYHPSLRFQGSCDLQDGYHRLHPYEDSAKRLLREAYTIKSTVQELNTEEADKLNKTIDYYVLTALKKYNRKNHASFKHMETVYSVRFRHNVYYGSGIFWVHLIFRAKENDSNCIDNSPVLFFAELGLDSDSVTCIALPDSDFGSLFPGDKTSHEVCPKHCSMLHPDRFANCKEGSFADSMWNGRYWAVKAELQQEAGDASDAARMQHHTQMEMEPTF